jgi:hypothetical protein
MKGIVGNQLINKTEDRSRKYERSQKRTVIISRKGKKE